jgi:hypothetical protein
MGGIIWLASYPKSGNTWLRAFLQNLLLNPPEPIPINRLAQFSLSDTLAEMFEEAAGRPVDGMSDEELAKLRSAVQRQISLVSPDSVFVKTHMVLAPAAGAPTIDMTYTAGAIYIVRDPRDVAISAASHFGTDLDGTIAIMNSPNARTGYDGYNVPQFYGTWSMHVRSWTTHRHRQFHVVRYEDMLNKPGPTFGGVAKFLGLKPPTERLLKAIKFSSFNELRRQEQKDGFIERSQLSKEAFFRQGRAGQWRDILTPAQAKLITDAHGEVMAKFDYR